MTDIELADELVENGMPDVADELREHGPARALAYAEGEIARLREYPDGDQLTGNLEIARERLEAAKAADERSKT